MIYFSGDEKIKKVHNLYKKVGILYSIAIIKPLLKKSIVRHHLITEISGFSYTKHFRFEVHKNMFNLTDLLK